MNYWEHLKYWELFNRKVKLDVKLLSLIDGMD